MAINFPDSPTLNQTFQQADRAWQWDGEKWKATGTTSSSTVGATVVFEGATDDAFETTLTATDPTADRTITLPNASGTVAFTSDLSSYAPLADPTFTGNVTMQSLDMDDIVAGDVIYGSGADTLARLAKGTDDQVLTLASGAPSWADATGGGGGSPSVADTTDTSCSVLLHEDATGTLAPKSDAGITYNASTGVLTATGFAGALTGNVTGDASGSSGSTTGNAATATALETARTIGGTSFDGTANITPANATLAATATALAAARTIGGVSFDGTADINLPGVNATGNQNTSGTAATVTGAAQTAITSVGTLTSLTVSGGLVAPLQINAQTGTTYTFVLGDAGKLVTSSNASAQTLTVPPNSSVAYTVGTQILVTQVGAGRLTLAEGSGVTINSGDSMKSLSDQYCLASLIKTATDTWLLVGNLQA